MFLGILVNYSYGQYSMLGKAQDDILVQMPKTYPNLVFIHKSVDPNTKENELLYIDSLKADYVFKFNKQDTCIAFEYLDIQRNLPYIYPMLERHLFIKQRKDYWENIFDDVCVTLETISPGDIFVLRFKQITYLPQ